MATCQPAIDPFVDIYLINLASRPDRRAFMEAQFNRLGLTAKYIRATSPADLSAEQLQRYCNPARGEWLEPGALCCSLSHLETMRHIVNASAEYALVLEDDVVLSERLPAVLSALEDSRPPFDILRVETVIQSQRMLPSSAGTLVGVEILRTFSWPGGSAGYIISRAAAKTVIDSGELQHKAADQALLDPYEPLARRLSLRQCNPGLVVQTDRLKSAEVPDMGSDITHGSRDDAERPYFWRRLPFVVVRWVRRDIIVGAQKAWFQYVRGAKKQFIPFLP